MQFQRTASLPKKRAALEDNFVVQVKTSLVSAWVNSVDFLRTVKGGGISLPISRLSIMSPFSQVAGS